MADKIVSLRMPATLVDELKKLAQANHYLDVSELIRSLLREKWLEHKDPLASKRYAVKRHLKKISDPEQIQALKQTLKLLEEMNEI